MVRGPPVVRCGPLEGLQEKNCKNCIRHSTNEKYTHTFLLESPLLFDLRQKVGEFVLSIISCPKKLTKKSNPATRRSGSDVRWKIFRNIFPSPRPQERG
jgi:hypothetical protein